MRTKQATSHTQDIIHTQGVMESFVDLGGGGSSRSTSNASFLQLPLPTAASASSSAQAIPPEAHQDRSRLALQQLLVAPSSSVPALRHGYQKDDGAVVQGEISPADAETIKAKIMSHPQYSALLTAYLDCQKVGAPPDVSDRLSAVAAKLDAWPWQYRRRPTLDDPELDQFMEAYCNMLVKYQEELARPLQEAAEFFKSVERQLDSITGVPLTIFDMFSFMSMGDIMYRRVVGVKMRVCILIVYHAPGNHTTISCRFLDGMDACIYSACEGAGSSEDDQDTSCAEEVDPSAEDKELKHQLLRKYGGYLGGLRQEFSKRKKKGKLPKEARQKLMHWWELHYKWPYPSETEKIALAEATGLDQKQINNWFINQRKRHWKPTSEDMPFATMMEGGGFHHVPHGAPAALYLDRPFMADGMYRLGS
ncbi:hypothetical protein EJB05_04271 [Eragrostis curvula]|uniref:Homeobox domain-containing protein n=1 Tax=Eragrostis curvula TaxID=38414 RepID=A0A5J9W7Y2_9POAL|nr:hypothetical protein EJB05_04271 [Eragrostis curvula]